MDIIRTAVYYIHGAELMKLIFAVLYVSRTMGLTRYYKTEVFFYIYVLLMVEFYRPAGLHCWVIQMLISRTYVRTCVRAYVRTCLFRILKSFISFNLLN